VTGPDKYILGVGAICADAAKQKGPFGIREPPPLQHPERLRELLTSDQLKYTRRSDRTITRHDPVVIAQLAKDLASTI
jgi:hypothetical protein